MKSIHKNRIVNKLTFLLLLSIMGAVVSCNSSEPTKDSEALHGDSVGNTELNAAEEYMAEIALFREETDSKIALNDKNMVEFRARIATQKEEERAESQKKIDALDKKNTDMKKRLADFKAGSRENWNSFKKEFSHDMDELGAAFHDLTVKNTKK